MLNQPAADAVRSALYVENYLDCVENLPEDIQRYLTRLHELDVTYRNYMRDAENFKAAIEKDDIEVHTQRKTLFKLEQVLISLQEVGDEKVEIGQHILDLIDNKYRALDLELRELGASALSTTTGSSSGASAETPKEEEVVESSGAVSGGGGKEASTGVSGGRTSEVASAPAPAAQVNSSERAKRSRRGRGEEGPAPTTPTPAVVPDPPEVQRNNKRQAGTNAKKKKRKSNRASNSAREDSPLREEDIIATVPADIDEPTYCLCDQISYGEMILCDNDLCPIEWFHFVCVSLTTKPKGKWFCPKCRGDRPNVMKPKSQFLKELERYNKEKEEKS